jgi:hypothetical protein
MPKAKVPTEDYRTPLESDDLNGQQLFLFRLPSCARLQDLDGARMALPAKSAAGGALGSFAGKGGARYTLHSADAAESAAVRAVVAASGAAEGSVSALTLAPAFKRHIVVRREVLPSAAAVAPPPSVDELSALPGVVLAYTVRTPPHTFVNFVPAGATLPGRKKAAAAATSKRPHAEAPSTESTTPKKDKKKKKEKQ